MLSQPDEIIFDLEGLKIIECYGPSEGFIKISSSGGAGPSEFTKTTQDITGLMEGQYCLDLTDARGPMTDSLRFRAFPVTAILAVLYFILPVRTDSVDDATTSSTFAWSVEGGEYSVY
jgi:hypothetical protein